MSEPARVTMSPSQAQGKISEETRNAIYHALLSTRAIPNIEESIRHEMQASGFMASLKAYIQHLFRNEGVTSMPELMDKVEAKILHDTQASKSKDASNGVNGVNGHSSESDDFNLALPVSVTKKGTKTVVEELDKVVDFTTDKE